MVKTKATGKTKSTNRPIAQGILMKYPSGYTQGYNDLPTKKKDIDELAIELLQWANYDSDQEYDSKEAMDIDQFAKLKSFSPYKFKRINDPFFQDCLRDAMMLIGIRHAAKWRDNKINTLYGKEMTQFYKPEFRAMIIDRVTSIIQNHQANKVITVIDPNNYDCPEIPEKK